MQNDQQARLNAYVKSYKDQLSGASEAVATLQAELAARDVTIATLEARISELEKETADAETVSPAKEDLNGAEARH